MLSLTITVAAFALTTSAHVYIPSDWEGPPPIRAAANACKLPAVSRSYGQLTEGFSARTGLAPSLGKLKANMMFVDFPDAPATSKAEIDTLYNHLMPRAADWYKTSSYGRLEMEVTADKRQFYRMPQRSDSYGWQRSTVGLKMDQYIRDAAGAVGAKSMFNKSDVFYIVPTRAAKAIWFSPTSMGTSKVNGVVVGKTVTFGQDMWGFGFKELNHETGHTMGLPDLYPSDGAGKATTVWVGGFDIMGLISGTSPDYLAWHKWKLGWVDDEQVDCITQKGSSKHIISPIEIPGGTKAVAVKLSATKAFVAEVRTNLGTNNATCSQGLIGYVINTAANRRTTAPAEVVNTKPSAKACARNSGQLSSAAVSFAKGEKSLRSAPHGITVTVDDVKDNKYSVTIEWDGTVSEGGAPAAKGGPSKDAGEMSAAKGAGGMSPGQAAGVSSPGKGVGATSPGKAAGGEISGSPSKPA